MSFKSFWTSTVDAKQSDGKKRVWETHRNWKRTELKTETLWVMLLPDWCWHKKLREKRHHDLGSAVYVNLFGNHSFLWFWQWMQLLRHPWALAVDALEKQPVRGAVCSKLKSKSFKLQICCQRATVRFSFQEKQSEHVSIRMLVITPTHRFMAVYGFQKINVSIKFCSWFLMTVFQQCD